MRPQTQPNNNAEQNQAKQYQIEESKPHVGQIEVGLQIIYKLAMLKVHEGNGRLMGYSKQASQKLMYLKGKAKTINKKIETNKDLHQEYRSLGQINNTEDNLTENNKLIYDSEKKAIGSQISQFLFQKLLLKAPPKEEKRQKLEKESTAFELVNQTKHLVLFNFQSYTKSLNGVHERAIADIEEVTNLIKTRQQVRMSKFRQIYKTMFKLENDLGKIILKETHSYEKSMGKILSRIQSLNFSMNLIGSIGEIQIEQEGKQKQVAKKIQIDINYQLKPTQERINQRTVKIENTEKKMIVHKNENF